MKTRLLQTLIEEFSYYVQNNSGSQLDALEPTLEYNQDQINLPTIWKTRLPHTLIEEFSWYVKSSGSQLDALEPPLEDNQDQMPVANQGSLGPF